MKTYLNLCIAGIALIISWCGTSIPQTVEQPIAPSNPTPVQTQTRSLTSSGYSTTGASRSPYSGSQFDVMKITDNSTQKRTYLIDCRGSWSACLDRRYNNMIPNDTSYIPQTGLLSNFGFWTLTGQAVRRQTQVPIDWVLLIHEYTGGTLILDYDDPSGERNMMDTQDIQQLIQSISV